MTTPHRPGGSNPPLLATAIATLLIAAACGGSAALPPGDGSSRPTPSAPTVVDPGGGAGGSGTEPGGGANDGGGSSSGGATGGGTGGGAVGDPGGGAGNPGGVNPVGPGDPQPTIVIPRPGQLNPRPVAPQRLQASIDGRHVLVKVSWWSGVEPCSVLDSVTVDRSGTAIAITILEGSSKAGAICIDIAMYKATIVDLGLFEPGTYTVSAPNGPASPITITIS